MLNHNIALALTIFTLLVSLGTVIYGIISTLLMQYIWENGDDLEKNSLPLQQETPHYSFTALIPARHEVSVIADTIKAIAAIDYSEKLMEALIICRTDDIHTIKAANDIITRENLSNFRVITFSNGPINKPHALNFGLKAATKDIVVVFDAEDQPHPNIYQIANTLFQQKKVDVLQAGVQLMNFASRWYSTLNVLEYFFWFKSTLHFFAKRNAIPLGGNTVFFKRNILNAVKGWDESCLTEDAEIGLRLSVAGAKIHVFYDHESATREETPLTMAGFIKQRTRWNQGFMQIFLKGKWLHLPTLSQKLLALYILLSPFIQAVSFVFLPILIYIAFVIKLPVAIVLLSFIPLYIQFFQIILYMIGFYLFLRSYNLRYPLFFIPFKIVGTFYFFQLLLSVSAVRALFRTLIAKNGWEKTHHTNTHRTISVAPSLSFS
ncbi:MAG TPA: glycosyltransferase [Candidatus Saccharimonadales bacterium]|nr:glycosyltransferase [Candidatus Saccharimonadales bacterium]